MSPKYLKRGPGARKILGHALADILNAEWLPELPGFDISELEEHVICTLENGYEISIGCLPDGEIIALTQKNGQIETIAKVIVDPRNAS